MVGTAVATACLKTGYCDWADFLLLSRSFDRSADRPELGRL